TIATCNYGDKRAIVTRGQNIAHWATSRWVLWFSRVGSVLPCACCDSLDCSPLDGRHETRCAVRAGRPRRATGSRAVGSHPERRSMSIPQGPPARVSVTHRQGVLPWEP